MKPGRFTTAAHSTRECDSPSRPIAPPIHLASVHRFGDLDTLLAASRGEKAAWSYYRRYGHPNGRALEETVAALEGAEDALACASGMSAVAAIFPALAAKGDRVVGAREVYGGTFAYLQRRLPRLGVEVTLVALERVAAEIRPGTKLLNGHGAATSGIVCGPAPLIRISTGIEDIGDILDDLRQALDRA
jgi:methionine-gamma-lyase